MAFNSQNYLFHTADRITVFDKQTGAILAVIEDLTDTTISNTSDTVWATGKNGVNLSAFDRNKGASISGTNATITDGLLATQLGVNMESGEQLIPDFYDKLAVNGATVVTTYKASGAAGAEVKFIYAYVDGGLGKKYEQAADADATHFSYDPETKTLTLPTDVFSAGDVIVAQYNYKVTTGKKLVNSAEAFAKNVAIKLEYFVRNVCDGADYCGVLYANNVKADGNFDIAFSDTAATHPFTFTTMKDPCALDNELYTMYVFDNADAE